MGRDKDRMRKGEEKKEREEGKEGDTGREGEQEWKIERRSGSGREERVDVGKKGERQTGEE